MIKRITQVAAAAALAAGLAACGSVDPYGPNNYPVSPQAGAGAPYYAQGPGYSQGPAYSQAPAYSQQGMTEFGRITNVQLVSNGTASAPSGNNAAGTLIGGVV